MDKVTLTNGEVIALNNTLRMLENTGKGYNGTIWYAISVGIASTATLNDAFIKTRNKLIEQYVKHKDGEPVLTDNKQEFVFANKDNQKSFTDEMEKLLATEVEVEVKKIPIKDIEGVNFDGVPNIHKFFKHLVNGES